MFEIQKLKTFQKPAKPDLENRRDKKPALETRTKKIIENPTKRF
jgi:hypothetical protein